MIVVCLSLALLAPAKSGIDAARSLYEKARYEDALAALGAQCPEENGAACEELRASIHVALGDLEAASGAFERLIAADRSAALGPDLPPKIQALFAEAKQRILDLDNLALEVSEGGDDVLLLEARSDAELSGLTAYVGTDDDGVFSMVPMTLAGRIWQAETDVDRPDKLPYYLKVTLGSGTVVWVGSRTAPRMVQVGGGTIETVSGQLDKPEKPDGKEGPTYTELEDPDAGLPSWALWSIVGGVGALVIGGVILAVVLSNQDEDPGSIRVGIVFEDDP